ncbi:MFS transporter [Amycolatopsis sp. MEPSY49]|uniref:MFS transporter n=1 Tax=Amycolatopsis sp. MEPSY49 TaxID=3151600 RepID=UPI003EF806FF
MATLSPPTGHRALVGVLAGTMLVDSLEIVLLGVALPSIRAEFGLSAASAVWALAAFPLGFGLTLVPGRRLGHRAVYLTALAVFGAAAVVAGSTDELAVLVAAEFVKGCCAALTAPAGIAVITSTFREGEARRRAMLAYSLSGTVGATAGMLVAGVLCGGDWRWAVLLPVPVVLGLLGLGLRHLPKGVLVRSRARLPRTAPLLRAAVGAASLNGVSVGLFVVVNLQLQNDLARPAWLAAVVCAPAFATLALSVLLAGRLITRHGAPRLVAAGAVAAATGCALYLALPGPGEHGLGVLAATVPIGLAYLCSFAALNAGAAAGLPDSRRPGAGLVLQTAVQFGGVLTVVPAGALLTAYDDVRTALLPIAAAAVAGLAAALAGLRARRPTPKGIA